MYDDVLLLSRDYQFLAFIHWRKAMKLMFCGQRKVEVVKEGAVAVAQGVFLPSVLRLLHAIGKRRYRKVRWSKRNVFIRDNHVCQYCGAQTTSADETLDHVLPRWRSGRNEWGNTVTACRPCNLRKGGCTPEEARMRLLRPPFEPDAAWFSRQSLLQEQQRADLLLAAVFG